MMVSEKERKRKTDKQNVDEDTREKKTRKASPRPRSPVDRRDKESRRKRKHSRSRSPTVKREQDTNVTAKNVENKPAPERKKKETDMLNTRTGGAYIPPARLRMMQAQISDKSSVAYQRLAWEALKKSIHGHINKINVGNIGIIIKELLRENIVRGRGLLCRSVIQAQAASPTFTNVYAALVAAVNSRFPNIGELLLKRLVIQFKRGFKRNDKPICISSASFIAHLVNQRIAHEILALELLTLLVETPTDDSVEVAIAFLKECGQKLTEVSSKGVNAIFEMLRNILHEGQLDKRVQYMIEVMFQIWKDGFKDHPSVIEELELVPEEEQFTHLLMLDDATDAQDILNVFKFDEKYEENEQKYKNLSKEILGSDAESGEEEGSGSDDGSDESNDEEEGEEKQNSVTIIDNTETNLIALRRTIYLTINSSLDFEECAHKLMKMQLKPGQEVELCHMFLDCCAEQRTYEKFYGLLAQRFCNINRIYISPFEEIFKDSYTTAHRLDTNRLRNVSKFFAHLLFTDSISWEVLECVKLNEEDTTSSSRIYIKILFQELAEYMGLKKLNDRLKDPTLQGAFSGVFPRDNPRNTRFSINFFTSIGLGGLTDELREHLKQMPKNLPPAITEIKVTSDTSSSSSSDSSSSSSDSSDSEDGESSKKKKKKSKAPKTPEKEIEKDKQDRWGHDGFYDTYGKDAKRTESQPPRLQRDQDNFAIPRDPVDKSNRDRNRDDNSYRDDKSYRNRNDEYSRGRDDVSSRRRDDHSARGRDDRSARDRDDHSARGRDDRSARDRDDHSARGRDDRSARDRDDHSSRGRDDRSSRDRDDHSARGRDDRSSRDRDDHSARGRDDRSARDRDDHSSRGRDDRSSRDRDDDSTRGRDDFSSRSRDDKRIRDYGRDNNRDRNDSSRSNRRESYTEEREDGMHKDRNKDYEEDSRSRRRESEKNRNYEKRMSSNSEENSSRSKERREESSRTERKDKDKSNNRDKDDRRYADDKASRGKERDKESRKYRDESDEDSDDKASTIKKQDSSIEGEDKSKKKKSKKKKSKDDCSRDSDDAKISKKKKKSKLEKENDWDIMSKKEMYKNARKAKHGSNRYDNDGDNMNEWDIGREESVAMDAPRYWDTKDKRTSQSPDDRTSRRKRER